MKIILDTNVLVSGIFFSGPPYTILNAWRKRKIELIISPEIFQEYEDISLDMQEHHHDINVNHFLSLILLNSETCYPDKLPEPITQDPKDDKFIACAITSKTKIIVSGDKHLLNVSGYKGIEVLTPRQFFEKYIK